MSRFADCNQVLQQVLGLVEDLARRSEASARSAAVDFALSRVFAGMKPADAKKSLWIKKAELQP